MAEVVRETPMVLTTHLGVFTALAPTSDAIGPDDSAALFTAAEECVEQERFRLVIDLRSIARLTSAALAGFLDIQEMLARHGGSLKLSNACPLVRATLQLTNVDQRVRLADEPVREVPRPRTEHRRLGEMLVARELVTQQALDQALTEQEQTGARIGEVLVKRGATTQEQLLSTLAAQLGLDFSRLKPGLWDVETARSLSRSVCERLQIVPLFHIRDVLTLATADAQSMPSINEVEERLGCRVRPVFATTEDIQRTIAEAWEETSFEAALVTEMDDDFEHIEQFQPSEVEGIDVAGESPIVNTVNAIIQRAIRERASDIHLEPGAVRSRVRMRVDGVLYEVMTPKADVHPALVSRLKVMANLDIAERRLPQDGRIQVQTRGQRVDLRFSSLPGLHGEKIVLRVLDKNQAILDVTQLGMANHVQSSFQNLLTRSHGLILVTGPTGSGKTTTLYAALSHLNNVERSVVTIEDPVEYQLDLINQNEVRPAVGLTFAKTLKHVLRQDPDIIMVGEIRERETAEIAVQAALTGHLVLSTLHTNDGVGAITRLMEMGIEPYLLSSALIGVVAQRLVRTVCPACSTSYVAAPEVVASCGWPEAERISLVRGRGCEECFDSGFRGRMAIHELIEVNEALNRLIVANPTRDELKTFLDQQDTQFLLDSGYALARAHRTSIEEVNRVVNAS